MHSLPAFITEPWWLQIAQRQASNCCFSVRAKLALPGQQLATSSVANENWQQADAKEDSLFESNELKERQGVTV